MDDGFEKGRRRRVLLLQLHWTNMLRLVACRGLPRLSSTDSACGLATEADSMPAATRLAVRNLLAHEILR